MESRAAVQRRAVQKVGRLAARQHGVVLGSELSGAGISRHLKERLIREGWLQPLGRLAFTFGPEPPTGWQRAVAAALAGGPDVVVSHSTAAAFHSFPHLLDPGRAEVTAATEKHPRARGLIVHRARTLSKLDVQTVAGGVGVTTPARTLVDLAPSLGPGLLVRVVDEGAIRRLWTPDSLAAALARVGRRRGSAPLRQILRSRRSAPLDSNLEGRAEQLLRGVGPFQVHHEVTLGGQRIEIDLARPELKVAVECDGWIVRGRSRSKFDRDRRAGNLLVAHGWRVVRLTSEMSDDEIRRAVVDAMLQAAASSPRGA